MWRSRPGWRFVWSFISRSGRPRGAMRSIVSTRVKIYGEGEWLDQKHGIPLAPTLAQAASRLRRRYAGNRRGGTADDVGDVSALPDLLDQIEHPIGSVTADGAYDGDPVYDEVLQRHPTARVIIPPRARAVLSEAGTTQRDEHLRSIEAHGRIGWQRSRWLWQAELGGNRDVSIQDRHRSASPRPDSAQSTDRSKNRLQRTQQDDQPRHADLHPYQMKREADGELQPNQSSCTNDY
jgi:hypothetical protein